MYQVIARKYRPQNFSELIGQEHVRTTLENAIAQNRIAHGYIFAGQRGTGKTTVARIVARCLNCVNGPTTTPCGACSSCREIAAGGSVDVIEIDAASNRGINEMRELRENIRFRPARDRFKVFIVDEAHQITTEAFNALLKTLEEPPEWVVFLLCTTESHKIPTTILSRCQQFSFRSVDFAELVDRMKWICSEERIEADAEVLAVLARVGEGSVRDSLSALDQAIACCGSKLAVAEVRELLGVFSVEKLDRVTRALAASDTAAMLDVVGELERNGQNLHHFCRELARYLRDLLVVRLAGAGTRLVAASKAEQDRLASIAAQFSEDDLTRYLHIALEMYRELQQSLQPRLHLELGLLRMVHAGRIVAIEEALKMAGSAGSAPQAAPPSKKAPPAPVPIAPRAAPEAAAGNGGLRDRLHDALTAQGLTFIADAVAHATVEESGGELRFVAPREFTMHLKSGDLHKVVQAVAGRAMRITVTAGESAPSPGAAAPPPDPEEDEVTRRALAHPEVRRFQELFPESQVRAVRNLRQ
jgi:DNA polymerase-3 subunit gamma/tau